MITDFEFAVASVTNLGCLPNVASLFLSEESTDQSQIRISYSLLLNRLLH